MCSLNLGVIDPLVQEKNHFLQMNFWVKYLDDFHRPQCTVADENHRHILPKKSISKSGFSLELMDQLHPNLNCRLLLSIEFTTAKLILISKAMNKARSLVLGELAPAALPLVLKA